MDAYFFLYSVSFVAILFAVFQDLRTREIANWLTFSLVAFVLAYRAFYSIYSNDFMFFIYGLMGVILFIGFGYLFYYSKVFAGGDAKLLFGIGGIFPYSSLMDYIYYGFGFIFILFTSGVLYTLIYSIFLVRSNSKSFKKSFYEQIYRKKYLFIISFVLGVLLYLNNSSFDLFTLMFSLFIFLSPLLFAYVKSVEKSCMIQLVSPEKLTEGDWLYEDVKVNGKIIKKNFAGLTFKEVLALRSAGKKVRVKMGIPFAPAFLIALITFRVFFS
ncbi:MAG: A24 family peptidase [Nanoarchaeota archaeon]